MNAVAEHSAGPQEAARMSRMYDKMERGEMALGTFSMANGGPEWVEILGNVGFDYHVTDLMITSLDWTTASEHMRAANRFNMTPWIRLQGYPWAGSADPRTVADVLKALSIGAEAVIMSVDTPAEVEAVLRPSSDWHRRFYLYSRNHATYPVKRAPGELEAIHKELNRRTLVVPMIESVGAAQQIDAILDVDGLRAIFLAIAGDLSRVMGHAGDPTHPEMRDYVKSVVKKADERGIYVFANVGYITEPNELRDAVLWMWDAGVRGLQIIYAEYLVQQYYMRTLPLLRQDATAKDPLRSPAP